MDYEEPVTHDNAFTKPCQPYLQSISDSDSTRKIDTTELHNPSLSLLKTLENTIDSALSPQTHFLKKKMSHAFSTTLALPAGSSFMHYTDIGQTNFDYSNHILRNSLKSFKESEIKETITSWLIRVNIIKLRHIVGQNENVYMTILIGNKLFKTSVKKNGSLKYDEVIRINQFLLK